MMNQHTLHKALLAGSVAVIGASDREGSLGTPVWKSLTSCPFAGKVFAVNPKYKFLGERLCYASVKEIAQPIDLAVVALRYDRIEAILEDLAFKNIRWAVLVATNPNAAQRQSWQARVVHEASRLGIRIIGTDSLGVIRPEIGLNASFWQDMPKPGDIGFIAQSSDMAAAVLAHARENDIGFSSVVNTGDEIDLGTSEALDFLAQDPATRVIVVHVEGIRNPREFFSALRAAARIKPVLVIRGGASAEAQELLAQRMGLAASGDDVFDAMVARAGALRFSDFDTLFAATEAFETRRLPRSPRLGIVTTGSSFAILAADAVHARGIALSLPDEPNRQRLAALATSGTLNPVDVGIDADARAIKLAVDAFRKDENTDAVLVVIASAAKAGLAHLCEALSYAASDSTKPVLTVWLSESEGRAARPLLRKARIATFTSLGLAVSSFAALSTYVGRMQSNFLALPPVALPSRPDYAAVRELVRGVREAGRTQFNEYETKRLLANIGLATASGIIAHSPNEAADAADTLGYPVVVKALVQGITHKADVGGVFLNLPDAGAVREAVERIGENMRTLAPFAKPEGFYVQRYIARASLREISFLVRQDPAFGPVVEFGAGIALASVAPRKSVALLPLTERAARLLIEAPQFAHVLGEHRALPAVAREELLKVALRLSELVTEVPALETLEIDPLLVDEGGCIVLNGSVSLSGAALEREPSSLYMTIAPEPRVDPPEAALREGAVVLRSLRQEDFQRLRSFISRLSPATAFARFRKQANDLPAEKILELVDLDYNREAAVAAFDAEAPEVIRGVARYNRINGTRVAEFGIVIEDAWQHRGLGAALMRSLYRIARNNAVTMLIGYVAQDNEAMCAFMHKMGFARGALNEANFITFSKRM